MGPAVANPQSNCDIAIAERQDMVEQLNSRIVEVHKLMVDYAAKHSMDAQELAKANSDEQEQLAAKMLKTDSMLEKWLRWR